MVKTQYRRYIRSSTDPFKRAVYCVIGSCDVNDEHKEVAQTADDYLWFKLCQINDEDNAEIRGERMTYSHLQSLILEQYGRYCYAVDLNLKVTFKKLFVYLQAKLIIKLTNSPTYIFKCLY